MISRKYLILAAPLFLFSVVIFQKVYAGHLLSLTFYAEGDKQNPLTVPVDIRISLWDVYDLRDEDIDENGDINTDALHYGDFQSVMTGVALCECGTIKVDSSEFNLPMTGFAPTSHFLQLEYKLAGASNTGYQVYDFVDDPPYQMVTRYLISDFASYYTTDAGPRTNWNVFTVDANNNATGNIGLQFGEVLSEFLVFSTSSGYFVLSDDLLIEGDLDLTGTLGWEDIDTRSQTISLAPAYPNSVSHPDGSENDGILTTGYDNTNFHNFHKWETAETTLQDQNIIIRFQLPSDFSSWDSSNPINFNYKTDTALDTDNKIDLFLYDTSNNGVTSLTNNTALASSSSGTWAAYSSNDDINTGATWTAGDWITIQIKLYANNSNSGAAYAGELTLNYIGQ